MTDADARDLACRQVLEILTDYLEGALPEDQHARLEDHLAACEGCRTYLDQLRTTIEVVGAVREYELDPDVREGLLRAFQDWVRE